MQTKKHKFMFSLQILQNIIDKNLSLCQYYLNLATILKQIELPLKIKQTAHKKNRRSLLKFQYSIFNIPKPSNPNQQQKYELSVIEQALVCKNMIQGLQHNINHVSTATNIGIIKETLKVYMLLAKKDQYEYDGEGYYKACTNPMSNIEKMKTLERIRQTINALTLYLLQKNITYIVGKLDVINGILAKMGYMITEEQFEFYYNFVWEEILEEQYRSQEVDNICQISKNKVKYLQIFHILALVYELQQIQTLKTKFITYLQSDNYIISNRSKPLTKQQLKVIKLRIRYINSSELLELMRVMKFNIELEIYYKKYSDYRKGLLDYIDEQNGKKKVCHIFDVHVKSTKTIFQGNFFETKAERSSQCLTNTSGQNRKTQTQTSQARRENQQKLQHQIFNKNMLNGYFIREQLYKDIDFGNVEFMKNYCLRASTSNDQDQISNFHDQQDNSQSQRKNGKESFYKLMSMEDEGKRKQGKQNRQYKKDSRHIKMEKKDSVIVKDIQRILKSVKQIKITKNSIKTEPQKHKNQPKIKKPQLKMIDATQSSFKISIEEKQKVKNKNMEQFFDEKINKVKLEMFYQLGKKIIG